MSSPVKMGHSAGGVIYGQGAAEAYRKARHGKDGAAFLDPHLHRYITKYARPGTRVVDLGCGAGPWSIECGRAGADYVLGIDIQPAMIDAGMASLRDAEDVASKIEFRVGDVADENQVSGDYDFGMSLNVGCNLAGSAKEGPFRNHFQVILRSIKPGGRILMTAPNSLDQMFTYGRTEDEHEDLRAEVAALLEKVPIGDTDVLQSTIGPLDWIMRATILADNGQKFRLVEPGENVEPGFPIFRKIPGGRVIPNNWHKPRDYLQAAALSGLRINEIHQSTRTSRAFSQVNADPQFGGEYDNYPPFAVWLFMRNE